jgi:aryl-alcohol dehydrogenase-like predicted oxidoreductase
MTRREAARLLGVATGALLLPIGHGSAADEDNTMLKRSIPSSGEKLPVIGLGSWQTFDVGESLGERAPLDQVLRSFLKAGGTVIDSSPMYGRSEQVIGDLLAGFGSHSPVFLATKVWTRGKQAGIESMERSLARFQTKRIELMQVHNLLDLNTHLATLREWKEKGRIRYVGVTHYNSSAHAEVKRVLRDEKLDFLQINYSIAEREAEERILPLAQERGVALLINRPFGGGDLFRQVRSKPLPEWATEFDCRSWAQFLLKWIVAHPAVTCAIPATSKLNHLVDNMGAGSGRLPDAKIRQKMTQYVAGLR